MKDIKTEFVTMYRLGYLVSDIPTDIMESIRSETDEMENSNFANCIPYNTRLVGQIEQEYSLVKSVPKLENYIPQLAAAYYDQYGGSEGMRFKLSNKQDSPDKRDVWVNFQKKHEFNPPHMHSGDLSYVIYVKIPYLQEDENNNPSIQKSMVKVPGMFSFLYVDQYNSGGIAQYPVLIDKNFEGKIILFSSALYHTVYPFYTSDEYRISVSGNIVRY